MIPDLSQPQRVIVTTLQGLEPVLESEMEALGVTGIIPGHRAVECQADLAGIYRLNYQLRTGLKVLVPFAKFRAVHPDHLYKAARKLPWMDLFSLDHTFMIDAAVASDIFTHSQFAALRLKDAICDHFRDRTQARPDVDTHEPNVALHLRIEGPHVQISLNTSGSSLHKRGYRKSGAQAPLSEVLAAGMLQIAGWEGEGTLLDPMCGSGTIAIEAAMMATRMPAGFNRKYFGFETLSFHKRELWHEVRQAALDQVVESDAQIFARDQNRRTLEVALENAKGIMREIDIDFKTGDFFRESAPAGPGLIVVNPPYGQRIEKDDILEFYRQIGDTFKQQYQGWTAYVLSANAQAMKRLGLRTTTKHSLFNGPSPCKFWRYDMYAGTKKVKSTDHETGES